MDLLAVRAPGGVAFVLLDPQGHLQDLDLLDDARDAVGPLQAMAADGAEFQVMVVETAVDLLRREGGALVLGMSGLAADLALLLALGRLRLGRLDEVRRGRLGGGRGVLAGGGQLPLQLRDGSLQVGYRRTQRIQLRLQPLAVGTGGGGFRSHLGLF